MSDLHTCSYHCDRPECIKAHRDELRERLAAAEARVSELERYNLGLATESHHLQERLAAAEAEIATLRDTLVLIDNRCYQDEWVVETIAAAMGDV